MELEFDRTAEDIIAFNLYQIAHSASARREQLTQRLFLSLLAAGIGGGFYLFDPRYFNPIVLSGALLAGLVVFWLYPFFARRSIIGRLRNALKEGNNESLFGRQTISISPHELHALNQTTDSKIRWSGVQKVVQDTGHVYLFTSAMNALVIPRRAFSSAQDELKFLHLVDAYRAGARLQSDSSRQRQERP